MLGDLLDFAGGVFGHVTAKKERSKDRALAREQFGQQMDHSVRRRVEDAQRAGIHPLFALGASVGASPTISAGGGGSGGNAMGAALSRIAERMSDKTRAATKLDEAEAALANARAAKLKSDMGSRGRDGANNVQTFPYGGLPDSDPMDLAEYIKPQIPLSRGGREVGTYGSRRLFKDGAGQEYEGFSPEAQMDEIGQIEYAIGLPERMWRFYKRDKGNKVSIYRMERELARLSYVRKHGGQAAADKAAREYVSKAKEYARKVRAWYRRYRSLYE